MFWLFKPYVAPVRLGVVEDGVPPNSPIVIVGVLEFNIADPDVDLICASIIFIVIAVFCYVLGSIGLMNLAKKNNIPNSWLSFLPIGRSYIIG